MKRAKRQASVLSTAAEAAAWLSRQPLVRRARALAQDLRGRKRELERILATVQAARLDPGETARPLQPLLPYLEQLLQRSLLELDDAWNDLDIGLSAVDLAQELRKASGPPAAWGEERGRADT